MTQPVLECESEILDQQNQLRQQFDACELARTLHQGCYDPGDRLSYEVTGVVPAVTGRIVAEVEKFVGGGFAGQVYRVRLVEIRPDNDTIAGLIAGQSYAIKILKPPTTFANRFRNLLYHLGYQTSFSAQVNPAAVRVGVLWQKLIRRAAEFSLGGAATVCDTYATFYDPNQHGFGEINEWVDGRIWKFEVDDRLFERWNFQGQPGDDQQSPEYVHKKLFMARLVALLHEMGAPELARQYEWWTCKSQPNVLKRIADDGSPAAGLTAIDFRAGLALLAFLPMSPIDLWLIPRGLARGRLVQFDRSDPIKLEQFIASHQQEFSGIESAVEELNHQEETYRRAQPDLTGHHLRLLTNRGLRSSVKAGLITAWKNLGRINEEAANLLSSTRWRFRLLLMLSMVPLLGRRLVRLWGNPTAREHLRRCLSGRYLLRAMRGSRIEVVIAWLRGGRTSSEGASRLVEQPLRFWCQRILAGWLPASWHRCLGEPPAWAWARLRQTMALGLRFLRHPEYREERLLDQVRMGREEGMLSAAEADKITAQIKDPYIQKYLRCLAVHVCTVPVTQVVMLLVGAAVTMYSLLHQQLSWPESLALGSVAAAAIQLMPISPGSITRGVFVLFLMAKERDIRNYYIAAPVSFLHVIGYLAFPLQMVAHNPALARFLAGRWTRNMARLVPVFGESGGLLEHAVFDLFFNLPLTIKRSFKRRPVAWSLATATSAALIVLGLFAGYCRLWEWQQPRQEQKGAIVISVEPYWQSGFQLHWHLDGTRVRLSGVDGPVDFPASAWDQSLAVGDNIDAVVRKSYFGQEFDGLEAVRHTEPPR